MLGISFHSFVDGVIYSVTFNVSVLTGLLAAAVSTPLGTLVSHPFINKIKHTTLGSWLATSAGALVYVGASHLLPAVEREHRRYSILTLAAGVLVALGIALSKGRGG